MSEPSRCTRRSSLKGLGLLGVGSVLGGPAAAATTPLTTEKPDTSSEIRQKITAKVEATTFIDTHEHLCEEQVRLAGQGPDDWSMLMAGYLGSDLLTAGMPPGDFKKFFSKGISPAEKWKLLEPFWPAVKTTGYGQAARISIRRLYGVDKRRFRRKRLRSCVPRQTKVMTRNGETRQELGRIAVGSLI